MHVAGKNYRTVWMEGESVFMINQNLLPFEFKIVTLPHFTDTCIAISNMTIRGAGAIGAAAAFALAQAIQSAPNIDFIQYIESAKLQIEATRPTAYNLFYATNRVFSALQISKEFAIAEAFAIANEDVAACTAIGKFGASLISNNCKIETHCNAGWLAFVDKGSALSPIYTARDEGKNVFVYVDETRPRSQGARLTAWELYNENIPHVIIPDNAGAWLMSQGKIDMVIVGADRIAANGDVANKIGTLEKAICAKEFGIPFYVAAPLSTFDLNCESGLNIPIEERNQHEVLYQTGISSESKLNEILVCSPGSPAVNPAFDVTPAKYITGIITPKGIITPTKEAIYNVCR